MAGGAFPRARPGGLLSRTGSPQLLLWLAAVGGLLLGGTGCPSTGDGADDAGSDGGSEPEAPEPAVTTIGDPVGTSTSGTLGPAGGELSSPDGRLVIAVPPGALTEDATLEIQPITNEVPGGIGLAYRLAPALTFAAPVELVFTWTEEEIVGSGPEALGVAFQTEERTWQLLEETAVDEDAHTLRASVDHFTDFAFFEQFRLVPGDNTANPGDEVTLQVEFCAPLYGDRDPTGERPVLAVSCDKLAPSLGPVLLSEWEVNGIAGGNSTVGTVAAVLEQGRYTAPSTVPSPATVSVSVRIRQPSQPQIGARLVARVTIVEDVVYIGDLSFTTVSVGPVTGSGSVGWSLFEDAPDVQRYLPSGVFDVTITPDDCDAVTDQLLIDRGTPEQPVGTLVVYIGSNPFADSYQFAIATVPKDIVFHCGDPRTAITLTVAVGIGVGNCAGPFEPVPFTDPDVLEGTWDCEPMQLHAEWRFTR